MCEDLESCWHFWCSRVTPGAESWPTAGTFGADTTWEDLEQEWESE